MMIIPTTRWTNKSSISSINKIAENWSHKGVAKAYIPPNTLDKNWHPDQHPTETANTSPPARKHARHPIWNTSRQSECIIAWLQVPHDMGRPAEPLWGSSGTWLAHDTHRRYTQRLTLASDMIFVMVLGISKGSLMILAIKWSFPIQWEQKTPKKIKWISFLWLWKYDMRGGSHKKEFSLRFRAFPRSVQWL